MATRIEQHIQDHCHTAQDVLLAAHKAIEMRHHWFKEPERQTMPIPIQIEPVVVFEAPQKDVTLQRDWLYVSSQHRADKYPSTFIRHIKSVVAKEFDIELIDIDSERRQMSLVIPRHVAFYLCKQLTPKSYPELGRKFGHRDHTTILHGVRATANRMILDQNLCQRIVALQHRLEQDLAEWRASC